MVFNPDNELVLVGGQISGWTAVTGVAPFNGAKYFFADSSAVGELRQDVDVTAWSATISARTQQFDFSAHVRSKDAKCRGAASRRGQA